MIAAPPTPTPVQIFARAQAAWQARAVPPYVAFQVACAKTLLAPQCVGGEVVAFVVRMSDGRTYAQTVASPGHAPKVLMRGGYIAGPQGAPLGFVRAIGIDPPVSPPPNLAPDPLRTIAAVTADGHLYDVTNAGVASIDGRSCFHLLLHPELDPDRFALRELMVDTATFEVVQLTYERPYEQKHARAFVRYRFAPVGPAGIWSIVHIEAAATVGSGAATEVESVSDDLSSLAFPAFEPPEDFEPPL
jgi:hypothetical protein